MRVVELTELGREMTHDGTNFAKAVVSRRTSWYESVIVDKVAIPGDVAESISGYPVCYGGVMKGWISSPVILNTGEFVDSHKDTKSHVGP